MVAVHVGKPTRILVVAGPTVISAECRIVEDRRREIAAAGRKRNQYAIGAKADDVGHAVPVHIGQLAGKLIIAGPAVGGIERRDRQGGSRKVTAAGRERDEHAAPKPTMSAMPSPFTSASSR